MFLMFTPSVGEEHFWVDLGRVEWDSRTSRLEAAYLWIGVYTILIQK